MRSRRNGRRGEFDDLPSAARDKRGAVDAARIEVQLTAAVDGLAVAGASRGDKLVAVDIAGIL